MKIAGLIVSASILALNALPLNALACSEPRGWGPAMALAEEDEALKAADVFYRGVIETTYVAKALGAGGDQDSSGPIVTIRRTRTLWGSDGPAHLGVSWEYLSQCPLPNLMMAYIDTVDETGPPLKSRWGVTVIGRQQDLADNRLDRVFILIDGAVDTQSIVTRFQKLRLGW